MPFPTHPPKQMPCPHWNHFPIYPTSTTQACGSFNGMTSASASPPTSPTSYEYCQLCKGMTKK